MPSSPATVSLLALSASRVLFAVAQEVASEVDFQFTADDISGALEDDTTETPDGDAVGFADVTPALETELEETAANVTDGDIIFRSPFTKQGNLVRVCGCTNTEFDFEPIEPDLMRQKSNNFLQGGSLPSSDGWSNLLWAWGQFLDHDLVATAEDDEDHHPKFEAVINRGGRSEIMTLHRLTVDEDGVCRSPIVVNSPEVDASQIYGVDKTFRDTVLREPGSCKMRTSPGNLLPVTTSPDEGGQNRFVAGDGRVNEHAILTGMHTLWVREHNRLCDVMDADAAFDSLDADAKFERARHVVMAKTQQITLKEFLPTVGISEESVRNWSPLVNVPNIAIEFFIAYRFGHDLIGDRIGSFRVNQIFNGEKFFGIDSAAGSADPEKANLDFENLYEQARTSLCANLDGRFADSLRNTLFGPFGEDLATRNMWRSMEVGMVPYDDLATCYGVPATPTVSGFAAQAGDDVPALALMYENNRPNPSDKPFGAVNTAILTDQFHRVFFGNGGLWWEDNKSNVDGFVSEIEATNLGKVLDANMEGSYSGQVFRT